MHVSDLYSYLSQVYSYPLVLFSTMIFYFIVYLVWFVKKLHANSAVSCIYTLFSIQCIAKIINYKVILTRQSLYVLLIALLQDNYTTKYKWHFKLLIFLIFFIDIHCCIPIKILKILIIPFFKIYGDRISVLHDIDRWPLLYDYMIYTGDLFIVDRWPLHYCDLIFFNYLLLSGLTLTLQTTCLDDY